MTLRVARLDARALLPTRAHPGDAGLDLYAVEAAVLAPGERASIPTGIAVEIPPGHAGLVVPRSGLAARHGISVVNAPGLIDADYRGEVRVLLLNTDREQAFELAGDLQREDTPEGVRVSVRLPANIAARFAPFVLPGEHQPV